MLQAGCSGRQALPMTRYEFNFQVPCGLSSWRRRLEMEISVGADMADSLACESRWRTTARALRTIELE